MNQEAARPMSRRLVQFLPNDPQPLLFGSAPIVCDGTHGACILAGSVGFCIVERTAGVTPDALRSHQFEIDVNDRRAAAGRSLTARENLRSERVRS